MSAEPGDGKLHGDKKPKFHDACESAWEKRPQGAPEEYVVDEIHVYGNNPITHYSVILKKPT